MSRLQTAFGSLIVLQAAHSVEEYIGRLWEVFPPARFVVSLVSSNPERGFLLANAVLICFGLWCLLWPIRKRWAAATPLAWLWVGIETINGISHPLWSIWQGGYTPGVVTAPMLLVAAGFLAVQLINLPHH
jgi:hypothetical protein